MAAGKASSGHVDQPTALIPRGPTVAAFESGGVFQPPAKKCSRTTEEAHPSAGADLIIPRECVPIQKALTESIEAFTDLDEHEFKVATAAGIEYGNPHRLVWIRTADRKVWEVDANDGDHLGGFHVERGDNS